MSYQQMLFVWLVRLSGHRKGPINKPNLNILICHDMTELYHCIIKTATYIIICDSGAEGWA